MHSVELEFKHQLLTIVFSSCLGEVQRPVTLHLA